jgi:hypothetical protein
VSLAGPAQRLGQLDEALVEGEIVTNRVLPPLVGATEEGELGLTRNIMKGGLRMLRKK